MAEILQMRAAFRSVWKQIDGCDTPERALWYEYLDKLEPYSVLGSSVQVYCAVAVEALLNLYGVSRARRGILPPKHCEGFRQRKD